MLMTSRTLLLRAVAGVLTLTACNPAASQAPINPPAAVRDAGAASFADTVEKVGPAVVAIDVKGRSPVRRPTVPGFPFDLFPEGQGRPPGAAEVRSAGSGFFISADGYVVTNNHVIENGEEITVVLQDKRELPARVVGRDEATDLAVLKVEGRNFPFVNFANSAMPRVGDWVVAVGNPFGLGGSATAGIVSAFGRDIGSTFVDYIQIDAPINRGNSGGPTFDSRGRVIGVNTMIFSPSGGSVGIGFAIPADVADRVTREIIDHGEVTRGYIGASIQAISGDIADSLGLKSRSGALVADVTPGGPADTGGLRAGDIVERIDGQAVDNPSQLTRRVAAHRPGETMRLDILRDGARRTLTLRAEERPTERQLAGRADAGVGDAGRLGVTVRSLDPAARGRLGIPSDVDGVLVAGVAPGSDAAAKGVRSGDVIVRLNMRPVATPSDLTAGVSEAARAGRRSVLLLLYRDGRTRAIAVRLNH